jgi:hypothetical protein
MPPASPCSELGIWAYNASVCKIRNETMVKNWESPSQRRESAVGVFGFGSMKYDYLVETYETERIKVLNV